MTTPDSQWLAQLGEEATEGPWHQMGYDDAPGDQGWWVGAGDPGGGMSQHAVAVTAEPPMSYNGENDATFIATARNLWAEMVAVVEAAEGLLAARGSDVLRIAGVAL